MWQKGRPSATDGLLWQSMTVYSLFLLLTHLLLGHLLCGLFLGSLLVVTFFLAAFFFAILRYLPAEQADDGRLLSVSLTTKGNVVPGSLSVNRNRRLREIFRGLRVRAGAPLMLISVTMSY